MSSGVGASGERCSSRVGNCRTEDAGRENNVDSPCLKAARPRVDSENPAGEGRSNSVEQQGRPAWPGRKSHKKTCIKDNKETHEDVAQNRQEEQRTRSLSSIQINRGLEVGQGSSNLSGGHPCPRPACSRTSINSLNSQSPQPASFASSRCSLQPRCTLLSPQGPSTRTADPDCSSCSSPSEPDLFWVNVRTEAAARQSSQSHQTQTHITTVTSSALGNEEEEEEDQAAGDGVEEGSGVLEVMSRTMALALVPPCSPVGERRTSKREKNRMRGLRRRQRRRERWRQSQQESRQSSTGNASSSSSEDEEDLSSRDRDGYSCAVCLDVYFNPYMCHPCNHIFCEPCLRTLAKNSPTNTPCPLCRTVITHVFFQKELNQTARMFFPKEYITRKQNFQKASCAKWPLPSCRKLFRIFGGFQRPSSPVARRQFRHGGGYRVDTLDFEDQSQGWRFDLDMIVIYIYSVNWVIGFFIFCFLCYLFFPSF